MNILLLGASIIKHWNTNILSLIDSKQNINIINKGIDGLKTIQLLDSNYLINLINLANSNSFDYIIFYCGGNDVRKNVELNQIISNLIIFLNFLQDIFPNTRIFYISIFSGDKIFRNDINYVNKQIKKKYINQNKNQIIQIKGFFNKKFYMSDLIHLNDLGYLKLTHKISNLIN